LGATGATGTVAGVAGVVSTAGVPCAASAFLASFFCWDPMVPSAFRVAAAFFAAATRVSGEMTGTLRGVRSKSARVAVSFPDAVSTMALKAVAMGFAAAIAAAVFAMAAVRCVSASSDAAEASVTA
jgi:uncharacterized membrane protein YedE/YeeE